METRQPMDGHYTLEDGFGVRVRQANGAHGWLEVLELGEPLAGHPAVEHLLRSRAARFADADAPSCSRVQRIEREGAVLRVTAEVPDGVRLSDLLADLEFGNELLPDAGALELAGAVVAAVAALHQLPGSLAHGALNPSHMVLTRDGTAVLTDAWFGPALEALQQNREQLWREYGVALPAAASLPRFDQRADVTQLGAVVLAIALRRPLHSDEYPRGIGDLVVTATPFGRVSHAPALRSWLEQALQLHPRAVFGSAVGAQHVFAEILAASGLRRAGTQAVQALVRKRCDTAARASVFDARPSMEPRPAPVHHAVPPPAPRRRGAFLQSVFSNLRAS
ncbi:MAG: hypothetical protein HY657_10320 [Acidobacteria bacterium]|nr:hypothetical protein [Acidobacteriota bacterium]